MTSHLGAWRLGLLAVACMVSMGQTLPNFLLFTDPGDRFSIEFPRNWQWSMLSGSGEPIASFVHPSREAAVVVERFRLKQRLTPDDITDLFAELEVDYIKENQRRITNIGGRVANTGRFRTAIIDYSRPGLQAQERVRQFSFPVGEDLYRITCMAVADRFSRYEGDFAAVVGTLRSAEELKKR